MIKLLQKIGTALVVAYVIVLPMVVMLLPSRLSFAEQARERERSVLGWTILAGMILVVVVAGLLLKTLRNWRTFHPGGHAE